jgi:hypothetical protein
MNEECGALGIKTEVVAETTVLSHHQSAHQKTPMKCHGTESRAL